MRIAAAILTPLCLVGCGHDRTGNAAATDGGGTPEDAAVPTDSAVAADTGGPALDPDVTAMLGHISESRLSSTVANLAGFATRNTCSNDATGGGAIGDARDWIRAQLSAIAGLTVQLDPFSYSGCAAGAVTRENVVAWKPGSGHPDRLLLLGGHYDSRTIDVVDGTSPAPGANDSGTQTALVLEAARVMAAQTYDATLVFVAFAGEEQGLVGSRSLAAGYGKYFGAGASIEAMFNCDIVGGDSTVNDAGTLQQYRLYSPGTPREIQTPMGTTDDTSPARGLMRFIATAGGAYVPSMAIVPMLREDRAGRGGDHESFLDQGIPGVRFIETIESPNAGTVGSHQHSPNDLATYVTPAYTRRVAQVVVASIASLARAPSPPLSIAATGSAAGPVSLTWAPPASGSAVDHYVVAARATSENFYHARVVVPQSATQATVTPDALGIPGAPAFFVSVAAVDAPGHESLFAYPEYRCDSASCVVQPGSLDVTVKQ
jgi:acetylornithine deacetylase/succinyl-diaminopimelate desuccinylase-like protein